MRVVGGSARPGWERLTVGALITVYLCATIPLSLLLNIWIDEAYSLMTTSKDLDYTLTRCREFELQPPFYFLQLWVWRTLNDTVFFARLNSIGLGAGAICGVYLVARRWTKDVSPFWLLIPFAANPTFIDAATEIRTYALVFLLSACLFLLFYDGFHAEKPSRVAVLLFGGAAAIALFTYYFLGFLLLGFGAALVVNRRWREFGIYAVVMGLVGLSFVGYFLLHSRGHIESSSARMTELPGFARSVGYVGLRVFSIPLGVTNLPKVLRWLTVGILILSATTLLWKSRKQIPQELNAIWVITLTVAASYTFVVRFLAGEELALRHLSIMLLPGLLAVVSVLSLAGRFRKTALTAWLLGAIAFNSWAAFQDFKPLARSGDYERAARFLESNETSGQSIVVFHSHAELPFRYYYRGTSRIVPSPKADLEVYRPIDWRLEDQEHARRILRGAENSEGEVWVYSDFAPDFAKLGVDFNFEVLEEVVESDYAVVKGRALYGATVRLLSRRNESGSMAPG